jgi:hypothetical protein
MNQPPLIKYNLNDRGRQYRGQPRNFDIKKLCASINGNATQERVKTRAMLGYYGHNPRKLAGMNPSESVVVAGKYTEIEPAIVTTFIKAYSNGDIEHQTEFLESGSGKKAALMWSQKVGGFSSAIDQNTSEFYGFDYVLDPNFSTNRGYTLDSTDIAFDDVLNAAHSEQDAFWYQLLASKNAEIEQLAHALDNCQADNEAMIEILAGKKPVLDDCSDFVLPLSLPTGKANQMQREWDAFKQTAKPPRFANENKESGDFAAIDTLIKRMGLR